MTNFVLVHGASHGSWCWDRVVPLLRAEGHQVTAVDLPGNGQDDTPPASVTLDTYAQHVCQVLDQQDGPVVLVGHSLGGLTITQTAEYRPDKIGTLVYLTALLLEPGEAFVQTESGDPESVRQALQRDSWAVSDDLSYVIFHEELSQSRFYNDCSEADFAWAKSKLVPQPTGPVISPLVTTQENFGRVPRVYIECLQDGAIPASRQKEMYTKMPCQRVISMATGHSPFLSAPGELAEHFMSL